MKIKRLHLGAMLWFFVMTCFLPTAQSGAETCEKATFAGGCFWCMEQPFDSLPGVLSVMPGTPENRRLAVMYNRTRLTPLVKGVLSDWLKWQRG